MKRILNNVVVERTKPPAKGQIEIFDRGYPGLALRVSYGGAKSFIVFYRPRGMATLRRVTIGQWPETSLAAARDGWRQVREAVARGEDPARAKQGRLPAMLFEAVVEEWLRRDQSKNRGATLYQAERMVEHDLLPVWRGKRIDDITKRNVIDLIDGIIDRGAPVAARRVHSRLSRLFSWCVERDILKASPMAGYPRPGSETARERTLTDDELRKVWIAAGTLPVYGGVVRMLMLTGCRKEEIAQLKWSEIEDGVIKLQNGRTKTGTGLTLPLSSAARGLLVETPRIAGCDFVFPSGDASRSIHISSKLKHKLDAACGVTGWVIHDLRRTLSTRLNEMGVEPHIVEAIIGHKVKGVAGVYNRAKHDAAKLSALEAWGAHVVGLVEGREPAKVLPMSRAHGNSV